MCDYCETPEGPFYHGEDGRSLLCMECLVQEDKAIEQEEKEWKHAWGKARENGELWRYDMYNLAYRAYHHSGDREETLSMGTVVALSSIGVVLCWFLSRVWSNASPEVAKV